MEETRGSGIILVRPSIISELDWTGLEQWTGLEKVDNIKTPILGH